MPVAGEPVSDVLHAEPSRSTDVLVGVSSLEIEAGGGSGVVAPEAEYWISYAVIKIRNAGIQVTAELQFLSKNGSAENGEARRSTIAFFM